MTLKIMFHLHETCMMCETCGGSSNTIVSYRTNDSSIPEFTTGTQAHCYDYESPDYNLLQKTLMEALESHGITTPEFTKYIPTEEEVAAFDALPSNLKTGHWTYAELKMFGVDPYEYWKIIAQISRQYGPDHDEFYDNEICETAGFVKFLRENGIEVTIDESWDENDSDDWWNDSYNDDWDDEE